MSERIRILEQIEAGEITVAEGVRRLKDLAPSDDSLAAAVPPAEAEPAAPEPAPPALARALGQAILVLGSMVLAGGGYLLARSYVREGTGGSVWGWVLLICGVLIAALGWWLEQARWLHVQIAPENAPALTLPLPIPLTALIWLARLGKPFSARLRTIGADELLQAMQEELQAGRSTAIKIQDKMTGQDISIYIG